MMIFDRIIPNLYYSVSLSLFLRRIAPRAPVIRIKFFPLPQNNQLPIILDHKWHFFVRDLYDVLALKEVFQDEIYRPIFENLEEPTTLIDIGSYIGDVIIYAQQFKNIKKIISVEPMPDSARLSQMCIRDNKIKNTVLLKSAVSYTHSQMKFYIHPNKGQSGFFKKSAKIQAIKVNTITLLELIKKVTTPKVIIKSDCEGAEYEIFTKADPKLLAKINRIIFEYHNTNQLHKILSAMKKANFITSSSAHPVESNLGIAYAYHL